MRRSALAASVLLGAALAVCHAPPAQAQMCPWGMAAQMHVQIHWQQQMAMQHQFHQHMQMHAVYHQMAQQQMMAHAHAMQMQHHAMQMHLAAQMHVAMQHQALHQHLTTVQHQQLINHHQATSWLWRYPHIHGYHGPHPWHPLLVRQTIHWHHTQHLMHVNQIHRVTHLQRITARPHLAAHVNHTNNNAARHLYQLATQRRHATVPHRTQQYITHQHARPVTQHRPTVQVRMSMGMTCGHCHASPPSAPTIARNPPNNPLKSIIGKPQFPRFINGPKGPMPGPIVQARPPLLPLIGVRPVVLPVVQVPRPAPWGLIALRLPVGPIPARPIPPLDLPPIAQLVQPPLGKIALLQPPPLPAQMHRALTPLPLTARTETKDSPSHSMQETPPPLLEGGTATEDSSTTATQQGTVMQLVSTIAQSKPAERRAARNSKAKAVLPDVVQQAPEPPALEAKYPVPPLMAGTDRPARPTSSRPSLLEVVLQAPPPPSLASAATPDPLK